MKLLLTGIVAALTGVASASVPAAPPPGVFDQMGVTGGVISKLDLPAGHVHQAFEVEAVIAGANHTLELLPSSIRADDFELIVVDAQGSHAIAPPPEVTYSGTVRGIEGSTVAATLVAADNGPQLQAMIQIPGLETYWIEPLTQGEGHLIYAQSQSIPVPGTRCGVVDDVNLPFPAIRQMMPPSGGSDAFLVCEMGIDTDFEYYQKNASNITTMINDISTIINNCSTIYQTDANVTFKITHFIVRTVAAGQPYTTTVADALLTQFDNYWSTNYSGIRRDLAHLFTGKNINGGIIGIAYLSAVCSNAIGYGLSESKFGGNLTQRTALTAHEVGHNFSAGHCDSACNPCTIMCSGIGGCAAPLTNFGCSAAGIAAYAATRTCLNDANTAPSPLPVPFADTFPATLDTKKWTANFGGATSAGGVNERTPSLSLNLDNADSIHSVWLDTQTIATTPVYLSFYSQHVGVPAGQSLQVQCYNTTTNLYQTLVNIPSDGASQTNFFFTEVALPASCISNVRSRLRFAATGTTLTEDWFIEDVTVDIYCKADVNKDRLLNISDFIDFQTLFALGDVLGADYTDDLALTIDDFIAFQTVYALGCY